MVMLTVALALVTFLMIPVTAVVLLTLLVVVSTAALVLREKIVVFGALHGRGGKAVAELDAADAGNSKNGVGHLAFHTVPERLSQADGKPFHGAFHHAAQGIPFGLCGLQGFRPLGRVLDAAHGYQLRVELGKIEHLFGNDAGGHNAQGDTSAEVAAATGIVEAPIFEVGREVCVTGTGVLPELLVVFAAGVFVLEEDGERGAGGMSLIHSGDNFRLIGLQAGGGAQGAGLAAGKIFCEIFLI